MGKLTEAPDEPQAPCLGYWTHTTNGSDFDCEYEPVFVCEECVVNGGPHDPRCDPTATNGRT